MPAYARRHAATFGRALVMPNVEPVPADAAALLAYRAEIEAALAAPAGGGAAAEPRPRAGGDSPDADAAPAGPPAFEPLMAFKLLPGMRRETVLELAAAGAVAGKYYPRGATTNSADGIADPAEVAEALAAMEEAGLVLSIHGEEPSAPVLEREAAFLPRVEAILAARPRLRIVLEHLSCRASLDFVLRGPPRLAATVTAHHLALTLDDLAGEGLDPWAYCKPLPKSAADRDALCDAVLRGAERLFFGSDSAPHPRAAKEGARAAAGIYAAPTALPWLAGLFDGEGRLDALAAFVAARGAAFYGLPPPRGRLVLAEVDYRAPEETDGARPFWAGRPLRWALAAS